MFISSIEINNFRIFDNIKKIEKLNIPDKENEGSGLNIIIGENGSGKTSILDGIAMAMLDYKADSFQIIDMNTVEKDTTVKVFADNSFKVNGVMPNTSFYANGFEFIGKRRKRKAYGSYSTSVVHDQIFIKKETDKPADNSPDLRVNVNNPFSGKRFSDTEVLYLDKNRLYQTHSGTYNSTRFDRIMEDFNFQYLKNSEEIIDLNKNLNETVKIGKIKNDNLSKSIAKFCDITGIPIRLDFIDNYQPFNNAEFVMKKDDNSQIELSYLGSGYEIIFSIIYAYYMSSAENKKLIVLIDEPELHLHPRLQSELINFLLEISKNVQVIITSHSPLLLKQALLNEKIKTIIVDGKNNVQEIKKAKLPYISANEINYIAFNLATEEYYNELYEQLMLEYFDKNNVEYGVKKFDTKFFVEEKNNEKLYPWKEEENSVSKITFVRNQIHHRQENGTATYDDLIEGIEKMREYL